MCADDMATAHLHQPDPEVLHDFEPKVIFDLEPVDAVTVTTLMDNVTDAFMPDQGPAHRPPLPIFDGDRQPATTMEGGDVPEVPLADGASRSWWTWSRTAPTTKSSSTPAPAPMG